MKRDRSELLLREPNLYKAFLILTLPVFGANFMKAFNELVDTYFIGQMANSVSAQAGVALAWPLLNIFASFQVGFGVAGVAAVSQLLGAGREERAKENAGVLTVIALLFGVGLNLLLYLIAPGVMGLMGAEGGVLECAVSYVRTRSFELVFTFLFFAFQAIRQARGDTLTPVLLSVTAVVLNIILTGVFVQVLGLGVFGAALATVLGNVAVAPFCLLLLFHPDQPMPLELRHLRVHGPVLWRLCRLAAPAASSQALSSLGFLVLQGIILSYGDEISAAFSIGNKVSNMLLMPVLALGSVLAAFVGQNIGAGNSERARQAYLVSRNTAFLMAVAGSLLLYPLRSWTVAALSNDAATQAAALEYLFWVLLTQPLMALFQNYLGVFNGSGKTSYAFLMSTCRLWVIRLPILTFFRHFTAVGASGVWYAMNISNLLILLLGTVLYRRVDFIPCAAAGLEEAGEEVTNQ